MVNDEQFNALMEPLASLEKTVSRLEEENRDLSGRIDDLEDQIANLEYSADDFEDEDDDETEEDIAWLKAIQDERIWKEEEQRHTRTVITGNIIKNGEYAHVPSMEIILPDGLETIGDNVFFECKDITSLTVPASVKSIGKDFCFHCTKLRSVRFLGRCPEGLENAFRECWRFDEIIVPREEEERYMATMPGHAVRIKAE